MTLASTTIYSDLALSFTAHPGSGDVLKRTDVNSVTAAMQFIIMAGPFDSPFDPNFGGNIRKMLFEPITSSTVAVIKRQILLALSEYEPRCKVDDLYVGENATKQNQVDIGILYHVIGNNTQQSISFSISRVR